MTTCLRVIGALTLLALLAFPAVPAMQSDGGGGKDWPTVGGGPGNARYSPLAQITTSNVSMLGAAWTSQKFDTAAASRAMAVVKDGMMFLTAPPAVFALDAKSGKTVWKFQTSGGRGQAPAPGRLVGSPAREGVAVAEGLVFVGLSDARAIALDEKTGQLIWDKYIGDDPRDKGQVISGAPQYAGGLVSFGLSADNGWRGQVVALDPKSGKEAWRFFVVPGPGEKGSDTWPQNSNSWKRGGGAVWLVGAADADLGTVYYATGNGVPQLGGEGRPGDNLFLCSVVALDAKTGKVKWHYQMIRHDIWEADVAIAPLLFDATLDGRPRKGIAAMRTDGYLFMLDRETGKPFGKIEDRPVPQDAFQKTAATQPFPSGADRVIPDCDWWKKQAIPKGFEVGCFFQAASVQKPNVLSPQYGMRVAPMSFDPQTGFFYTTGSAVLTWLRRVEDPYFFSTTWNQRVPGVNALGHGVLAAIDSRTNKIVWQQEYSGPRPSGELTTAGGLLFQAIGDGNVEALDAKSGKRLWQFQVGAAGGPPLAYEIDGQEYIATIAGAGVWAFALGGKVPPVSAPARPLPDRFAGQITDTTQIETASLARDAAFNGARFATDEYAFTPYRARVKVGAQVTWRNNGRMAHTIVAEDGSWTTGRLETADVGGHTFDKPGTYVYTCKEHPWAYGQIIVTE